jgi:hypothetical protein
MVSTKHVFVAGALILSWALSACGDSPTTPSTTSTVGTYTLVSANRQGLPAAASGSAGTSFLQEVTGGMVELRADQTFAWRTDYRYTNSGQIRTTTSSGGGRYSLSDTAITFTYEPGSEQLTGTLSNGVLTIRADVELVYRK